MEKIKIEIKWAIIFSIMGLLWMVLEKAVGLHDQYLDYHLYLTNLFAIPAIIVMVLALKDKKRSFYNGRMTYKEGLISGIILSVLIALLSPVTQWITSFVITPEYFPNVIKRSVELEYYQTTAEAEAQFNYKNYAIQGAIGALIMGIITTDCNDLHKDKEGKNIKLLPEFFHVGDHFFQFLDEWPVNELYT